MSPQDSRLDLTLRLVDGQVAAIRLVSGRPTTIAAAFAGRAPAEVLALLPVLFSLCGTAQTLAGQAAIEAASGLTPPPPQRAARRLALLAEIVTDHGTAIARDWPGLIGEPPNLAAAKTLRAALGGLKSGRMCLNDAVDIAAGAVADLPVERLIAAIAADCPDFGRGEFRPMPAGGPPDLGRRMGEDAYLAAPDCDGLVYETGALARHHRHPAIAALVAAHGNGLLPRLEARRIEMIEAMREMRELAKVPAATATASNGEGLGVVEAARGLLAHRVELVENRIAAYRILAPTEWNFHPRGPLAGLVGMGGEHLMTRARALVTALDPCVACTITLAEVPHA